MSNLYIERISNVHTYCQLGIANCKSLEEHLHFQHHFYGLILLLTKSCCLHSQEQSEVTQLLGTKELNSWSSAYNIQ